MDLNLLLELKKMARSTFYYHMKNIGNDDKYKYVKDKIATIFHKHKGRYGYRRVTEELRKDVHGINHKTVKRLMDELGLKCEVRKVRYRSYKGDVGKTVSNVINRDFTADRPLQKVATDVTQINIGGSKIYLSPVLDMFNGEILSYVISESPNLKMVMDMLNQLYDEVGSTEGMLMHSDQGWHYQHAAYQRSLKNHHIIQSMSRKGNCLDNSVMENFFGIMKSELLYAKNDGFEGLEWKNEKNLM